MYGWGSDDRSSDDDRSSGYDYSGARDAYSGSTGYSGGSSGYSGGSAGYSGGSSSGSSTPFASVGGSAATAEHAAGKRIRSESAFPVLVRIDVTGSNKKNIPTFWEKLPLLFKEADRVCPGVEISFAAIGDASGDSPDRFPLQVRDFKSGAELDGELNKLYPEGGGGRGACESYELSAVYDLNCVDTPNARQPFLFILCDEMPYPQVDAGQALRHAGVSIEVTDSKRVYEQLKLKYNLYVLHSPYGTKGGCDDNEVVKAWQALVGEERVLFLDEAARVVDAIIGVMSLHAGKGDDFKTRLTARQTVAQVNSVMSTLGPVTKATAATNVAADAGKTGKSVMKGADDGSGSKGGDTKSKPLM